MRLSELIGERAEAEIGFPGGKIAVGYRPTVITPRYMENSKSISEALPDVVTDWPLQTDAGEPIPLTVEAMQDVPSEIQEEIWFGILRARRPNLQRAGNSPENSSSSG